MQQQLLQAAPKKVCARCVVAVVLGVAEVERVAVVCVCGCVAMWPCGCVAVWLCGCVLLCGCVAVWPCGCVAV